MTYSFPLMLGLFAANVLTPGASFILTLSKAMIHGRRAGFFVAMGLVSADVVFAILATTGLAALVSQNMLLVKAVTLIGGVWFVYSGTRQIFRQNATQLTQRSGQEASGLPQARAWREGFTAGAFNAQAILFFASIFAAAVSYRTSLHEGVILVLGVAGFVAVMIEGRATSICEVLLILRGCRIDQRQTDGHRERTSSVLSRSCASVRFQPEGSGHSEKS